MCGFGGYFALNGSTSTKAAEQMAASLTHRGPDSEGIHSEGPIELAFRRLAILDPTPAGHQPMSNADESVWIVFNGEIYNYRELRDRVSGYDFNSETDTEVLLHLYEEYGIECLSMLRGMYAFAIWDTKQEQLSLARDRLGQKPLFYHHNDRAFRFGSTIRTLLSDPEVEARPDADAIRSFLTYQYVPAPNTGFQGINCVRPGEYLVVDEDGIQRNSYWNLSYSNQFDARPGRLAERLREKLREATRLRMRSDVPLGVFLSGGLDSTIVTGLMAEQAETPINTYSIGFDEYDELEFARAVADKYSTNHHEHIVTPDAMEVLPEIVEHYEMPFGDPSVVPTYYVSEVASEDITVAVGGDAGDENFAGYDRYTYDRFTEIATKLPKPVRDLSRRGFNTVPNVIPGATAASRGARLFENAENDTIRQYANYVCHMLGNDAQEVWEGSEPDDEIAYIRAALANSDGPTRLDRVLDVDINTYLPDDLLVKIDRASMAHSIEARSPFLDHEVVEFAARIPAKYKWHRGNKKWILKRAFEDYIPETVQGRSKQGFSVPVDAWFRGELRELAREKLEKLGARPLFENSQLKERFIDHINGNADYGHHLWDLVVLEMWYERFID